MVKVREVTIEIVTRMDTAPQGYSPVRIVPGSDRAPRGDSSPQEQEIENKLPLTFFLEIKGR